MISSSVRFARIAYYTAAVYGFATLLPSYFLAGALGHHAPPPLTHPEFYYGFVGLALLWQIVFVLIARNPVHYLALIPVTVLEKAVYSVPALILYALRRIHPNIVASSLADPIFGILFLVAWLKLRRIASAAG